MKKTEVYISHVMFPYETFADVKDREEREKQNAVSLGFEADYFERVE